SAIMLVPRDFFTVRPAPPGPGRPTLFLANLLPAFEREISFYSLKQNHARARGMKLVGGAFGQQGHVAAPRDDVTHALPVGITLKHRRALAFLGNDRAIQFDQPDLDLAVHHDRGLV